MKVLSLFDGISCGRVALERAGIPVEKYIAYEIAENSIKISKKNYPDIIHEKAEKDRFKRKYERYYHFVEDFYEYLRRIGKIKEFTLFHEEKEIEREAD